MSPLMYTFPSYILGSSVWRSFLVNPAEMDCVFQLINTEYVFGDCGTSFQNFRSVCGPRHDYTIYCSTVQYIQCSILILTIVQFTTLCTAGYNTLQRDKVKQCCWLRGSVYFNSFTTKICLKTFKSGNLRRFMQIYGTVRGLTGGGEGIWANLPRVGIFCQKWHKTGCTQEHFLITQKMVSKL